MKFVKQNAFQLFSTSILFISLLVVTSLNAQQPTLGEVTLLTDNTETGGYFSPRWSPDGKKIAFTKMRNKGIYVIDLDNPILKKITDDEAAGYRFSWGPDGKEIIYRSQPKGNRSGVYALKMANLENGETFKITEESRRLSIPTYLKKGGIVYQQDGKLKHRGVTFDPYYLKYTIAPAEEMAVNIEASVITEMPTEGRFIIENNEGIRVINSTGSIIKIVTNNGKKDYAVDAKASPDGKKIMFFNNVGPIEHLYVYEMDSEAVLDLGSGYFGQWLPDGRIVYCITENDGHVRTSSQVYIINPDGKGRNKIATPNGHIPIQLDVSPDGKSIAYRDDKTGNIFFGQLEE